jgi:uncharacterized iron-regulated membrane protein
MRKRIWQIHSWLGLITGLALVLIGLTGSVLVFHRDITRTLHPEIVQRTSSIDEPRLPLSQMIAQVESAHPDYWVRGWLLYHGEMARDKVYLTPHADSEAWHIQHVDPATGHISGPPVALHDTLYGWFVDLHYNFFAEDLGMAITAFLSLVFIALSLTGLYLYRTFFKTVFRLRWSQSWRIFSSDLHKAVGISSLPFNLLFGLTGAYWNIAHIVEEWSHDHDEPEAWSSYEGRFDRIDELPALAEIQLPGYAFNYVYCPTAEDHQYYIFGQTPESHPFRSRYGSHLTINAETLEVVVVKDLRTAGWWARVVDAFEPLHFGDFGGLVSKILWCLAGLAPGILTLSGTTIWFQRRRQKRTIDVLGVQ